jgi:hydroxyethylthiazole kinase-like uncharacterized protein yjeF
MPPAEPVLSPAALRNWPLPQPSGNKTSRGRLLVVGGARTAPGAAMLAGLAGLRVGAGVLTLAVAASVAGPIGAAAPEAGLVWLSETAGGAVSGGSAEQLAEVLGKADALLVGPGLDDPAEAAELVTGLAAAAEPKLPIVLDAYALGVLTELPDRTRQALRGRLVLTPNQSELGRLLPGDFSADGGSAEELAAVAEFHGAVLSSNNRIVAPDGACWSVPAGHSGLGTSGSGDVLAGALSGLLARGVELNQAACWATYLHAAAGDRLAARVGALGFLARELLDELPLVLTELRA